MATPETPCPEHWDSCVHSGSRTFLVIVTRTTNHNKIKLCFLQNIFFLSGCYSSILIRYTGACSGLQGGMVVDLGTKLRKSSFSFFLFTKECSFPNQSDRKSSKAKQQTCQLIQALFLQMILYHTDRDEAQSLTLFLADSLSQENKSILYP